MIATQPSGPEAFLNRLVKVPPSSADSVASEKSGVRSTASTGTMTMAQNIRMPWIRSVQHTAKKPPKKV